MKIYNIYSCEYDQSSSLERYFLSEENAKKAMIAMQEEDELFQKQKIHFKLTQEAENIKARNQRILEHNALVELGLREGPKKEFSEVPEVPDLHEIEIPLNQRRYLPQYNIEVYETED